MDQGSTLMERVLYEVKKTVVGQDHFLERVLVAMLAGGHLLVEGVPGLAKTLTVKTLAATVRGSFRRIQFTPDLVPADLVGEQQVAEHRAKRRGELAGLLVIDARSDEVRRHEVRRELDAPKRAAHRRGERLHRERFRQAGAAFHQQVPARATWHVRCRSLRRPRSLPQRPRRQRGALPGRSSSCRRSA